MAQQQMFNKDLNDRALDPEASANSQINTFNIQQI